VRTVTRQEREDRIDELLSDLDDMDDPNHDPYDLDPDRREFIAMEIQDHRGYLQTLDEMSHHDGY